MGKLADLARRLEELGSIPAEAIAAGAEYADAQIRKAGRVGGSLHEGNAVVVQVQTSGLAFDIRRVASTKGGFGYGIRGDYLARWVAEEVKRKIAERLGNK
jgi:hypothetical protein